MRALATVKCMTITRRHSGTDASSRRTLSLRLNVKGAADKAKGAIKEAAGKVTGDRKLQTEGKIDKAKGAAHNVAGDVKDAVRKADK